MEYRYEKGVFNIVGRRIELRRSAYETEFRTSDPTPNAKQDLNERKSQSSELRYFTTLLTFEPSNLRT